jgi:hypothetical protein
MSDYEKTDVVTTSRGIGFFGLLTIVFITLKLIGVINWHWIWVLSPIIFLLLIKITILLIIIFISVFIIGYLSKK